MVSLVTLLCSLIEGGINLTGICMCSCVKSLAVFLPILRYSFIFFNLGQLVGLITSHERYCKLLEMITNHSIRRIKIANIGIMSL